MNRSLTGGTVFEVLDVAKCEVIWLELKFGGQDTRPILLPPVCLKILKIGVI